MSRSLWRLTARLVGHALIWPGRVRGIGRVESRAHRRRLIHVGSAPVAGNRSRVLGRGDRRLPRSPGRRVRFPRVQPAPASLLLTRKSVSTWAGGSTRRSAAEPGGAGPCGSGHGWLRWVLQVDLQAGEVFKLADEVVLATVLVDP